VFVLVLVVRVVTGPGGTLCGMARVREFPPVVIPVDRVTLHVWRWTGFEALDGGDTAEEALRRGDYGPAVGELLVADEESVTFWPDVDAATRIFVVAWLGGEAMYWHGPTNQVMPGDSVSFGPLPITGTIEDAS
jgi:hypothetical protein